MSGIQDSDFLEDDQAAFEYVVGTLQGKSRVDFERKMVTDEALQQKVLAWQEKLIALNSTKLTRRPRKNNWSVIENRINPNRQTPHQLKANRFRQLFKHSWFPWLLSGALSVLLLLNSSLLPIDLNDSSRELPIDYVAVMTTLNGEAALSTIAKDDTRQMWLHWGASKLSTEQNYQLWAVSRSDSETRSISVLANTNIQTLELSEAGWRLVTDADYLLLTIEEVGGSPIDEPSEQLVAKGLCVRLIGAKSDV
jgi:anti-sigma-K factor RskA